MDTTPERPESAAPSLLTDLQTLDEYREQRERVFPASESLRWFIRQHRAGLEECGALLRIQGRLWLRAERADKFVLKAGEQAARRAA